MPHAAPFRRAVLLATCAVLFAGCATAGRRPDPPQWPLPPDKPRVRFVQAFKGERELEKGAMRSLWRVLVPPPPDAIVQQPTGLALSPDERYLYVTCSSVSRVLRFDRQKGAVDLVADGGERPSSPFGVVTDAAGNFYISDLRQNAIWAYRPDGKLLWKVTDSLEHPTGMAIDRRRQLLYVVAGAGSQSKHHRVEVFSLAGKHLRTIGTRGSGPGEFNFPANLAVAKDGSLYVVDMLNFRVQVFDGEGQLVSMFGTIGAGQPGTFDKAKSIAFDTFGNIYVVDSAQAFVQLFNPKFQPLMAFGGRVDELGYFKTPTAIAISSKNEIFVADFFIGVINEYALINTTAADSVASEDGAASPTR